MIWIADVGFDTPPTTVGDHHWVIDNVLYDASFNDNGRGIVAMGVELMDVKLVGNRVSQSSVAFRTETMGAVWVVGNTGADATSHAIEVVHPTDGAQITGNVGFAGAGGLSLAGETIPEIAHNTFLHNDPSELTTFAQQANPMVFADNLLASEQSPLLLIPTGSLDSVTAFDRNWYVPDLAGDCIVHANGMDLQWSDWASAAMLDGESTCAETPIMPAPATPSTADEWDDDFLEVFVPPRTWERCDDPAGAYDCDGNRLGTELRAIPSFADNGGKGWEGPLEVRLRYRF
jgi:hypothetical protein